MPIPSSLAPNATRPTAALLAVRRDIDGTRRRGIARIALPVALALLAALARPAVAGDQRIAALIDTDANAATGCSVVTPTGTVTGIEVELVTTVTTTSAGATVTRVEHASCHGSTLDTLVADSTGPWPAGLGNGTGGVAAVETSMPLALLGAHGSRLHVTVVSQSAAGASDRMEGDVVLPSAEPPVATPQPVPLSPLLAALATGAIAFVSWPALRRRASARAAACLLLALVAIGTAAAAVHIVLDGNVGDWAGIAPFATSAKGDAPVDSDLVAGYATADDATLAFRFDADIRADATGTNAAPVVSAGPAQTIALPAVIALSGSASDDGLPDPPAALTLAWTVASAPPSGSVAFADATAATTTATVVAPGTYVLRLTADDGALSTSSDVTITVADAGPTLQAIADRTIGVGTHLHFGLVGNDPDATDALSYSLDTKPAGATIAPTRFVDWTPTSAQLGSHPFVARVTDTAGHSATRAFTVTVVAADRPPALDTPANTTLGIGAPFALALSASDPDASDVLTYALVTGPTGMTISGHALGWDTGGRAPGDYPVTVSVTDSAGESATARFVITLVPASAPVANPDEYQVTLGTTLTVPAPSGVLANDVDPMGGALSATRLTDPDKGTLVALAADGSFAYVAPPTLGLPAFTPTRAWVSTTATSNATNVRVIPVAGRGAPVILEAFYVSGLDEGLRAVDGASGAELWNVHTLPAPNDDCYVRGDSSTDGLAAGDIDDSGHTAVVAAAVCDRDRYRYDTADDQARPVQRMVALDAQTGALKWLTGRLGTYVADADGLGDGAAYSLTDGVDPVIARLHEGETPSILFKRDGGNSSTGGVPFCAQFDASATDPGMYCIGVVALDGATGQLRKTWIAPANLGDVAATRGSYGSGGFDPAGPLVVAPIGGACAPCLMAGGAVWDVDGNLVSNTQDDHSAISTALARLDDGSTAIIRYELGNANDAFVSARRADGTLMWKTAVFPTTVHGYLSIADVDGDGSPDVLVPVERQLWALDAKGRVKWIRVLQDESGNRLIDRRNRPAIFDLDGDGVAEVIVQTAQGLLFLDGRDGSTKAQMSGTDLGMPDGASLNGYDAFESPVIADVDGSGQASVVLRGGYGGGSFLTRVVAGAATTWRDARAVYGQHTYHVADIADDGSIPGFPLTDNFALPATNVFGNQSQTSAPVDPRKVQQTTFTYTAGAGGLISEPGTVTITIEPQNRPPVFTTTPPTHYVGGGSGAAAAFMAAYVPHATDPDVGDTVAYSIAAQGGSIYGCTVDASTGQLSACGGFDGTGGTIVVAATDSRGAATYQTITLQQSPGTATVPDVTGQLQASATTVLAGAGFAVGEVTAVYAPSPAGTVLSQSPGGSASGVALGEAVALTVSKGLPPTAAPDVVGSTLAGAQTALANLGFSAGTLTYVFNDSVPRGEVMVQSPAAGVSVVPGPVDLTLSAGSGLELEVSRGYTTADVPVTLAPIAIAIDGTRAPASGVAYTIAPVATPYVGSVPTIAGNVVSFDPATRGAFRVSATDGSGHSAHVDIGVAAPAHGSDTAAGVFATLASTLETMDSLLRDAKAADDAGDATTRHAKLVAMVNAWRAFDSQDLVLVAPFSPDGGFPPTTADLISRGVTPGTDDPALKVVLRSTILALKAWEDGLAADGTSLATLDALYDAFYQNARKLDGLAPTQYGIVDTRAAEAEILSHRIPGLMNALTNEIARVVGLPTVTPALPMQKAVRARAAAAASPAPAGSAMVAKSTLGEVLEATAINAILDQMTSAKQFAHDILVQAAWGMGVTIAASELRSYYQGVDAYGVVAGASLSVHEFASPNSMIEGPNLETEYPDLNIVALIGPDVITQGLSPLVDAIGKATKWRPDPADPDYHVSGLSDIYPVFKKVKDKIKELIEKPAQQFVDTLAAAFQTPDDADITCLFADSGCQELIWTEGFASVYHYSPPPGLSQLYGPPSPILTIVYNPVEGQLIFATPEFLPTPPVPAP